MASSSQTLHVKDNFNAEDAAYAAQEFVSSLDNLPGEVTFLLEEIREKDARINQLLSRINTRHFGLTKHARNNINSARDKESNTAGQTTPPFPLPLPAGAALPTGHLSTKDAQALTKIIAEFAKVEVLQQEKIVLAERMERIVGRAKERGRAEWLKVGGMDLEEVAATRRADEERNGREGGMGGGGVVLPSMGLGSGDRRKKKSHAMPLPPSFPISGHTIHPPPNTSMPPPPAPRGPGRRRADRHQSTTASLFSEPDPEASGEYDPAFDPDADGEADADGEVDAEGEVEYDEGDAEEASETDNSIYCSCRQKSYGEMIGCDNDDCPIEWYHLKCVGIQGAPPDKWYCPTCVINLGLSGPSGRISGREKKGRKGRQ